jgi:hypothetical protein
MKVHSVVSLLSLIPASTRAHSSFQQRIPNGANVVGPDGSAWLAVGHQAPAKGTPLNAFGADFKAAGLQWTVDLCRKDSDGDGRTNGQELGDPTCVWTVGETPTSQVNITHPGLYNTEFTGIEEAPATTQTLRLPTWLQLHIACMMLSWGFLLPIGALMAISFRNFFIEPKRWFQLHICIQMMGVVLNVVGFCIPFLNMALHFTSIHGILGTVVFAMGVAQAVQGFLRPSKQVDEKPTVLRRVWEVCHKSFGRIVIVLAWTNMFLGIQMIRKSYIGISGSERVMTTCKALLGIQISLCVLLTAVSLFYKSKPKEEKNAEVQDEINETAHMRSTDSFRGPVDEEV